MAARASGVVLVGAMSRSLAAGSHPPIHIERLIAATKRARASGNARPRGAKACRSRKNPVSTNASARAAADAGSLVGPQEARKPHQLVAIGFSGRARNRAAGARRDIDEIGGLAGRDARRQIEAEAELGKERELEACDHRRHRRAIVERVEDRFQRAVDARMRLALGKEPAQRGEMGDAVHRVRGAREIRRRAGSSPRPHSCRDGRRAAPARWRAANFPAAAPRAAACRYRRERARDGGRAHASSVRE